MGSCLSNTSTRGPDENRLYHRWPGVRTQRRGPGVSAQAAFWTDLSFLALQSSTAQGVTRSLGNKRQPLKRAVFGKLLTYLLPTGSRCRRAPNALQQPLHRPLDNPVRDVHFCLGLPFQIVHMEGLVLGQRLLGSPIY